MSQENVYEVMDALGKYDDDILEFIDLNKDNLEAKKNYINLINRCDEMERKIM